jgi:hypothetical protein
MPLAKHSHTRTHRPPFFLFFLTDHFKKKVVKLSILPIIPLFQLKKWGQSRNRKNCFIDYPVITG